MIRDSRAFYRMRKILPEIWQQLGLASGDLIDFSRPLRPGIEAEQAQGLGAEHPGQCCRQPLRILTPPFGTLIGSDGTRIDLEHFLLQ